MASGVFGTGISALNAAQAGMMTTSHNISNAATPGFHRQSVVQRAAIPQFTGAGYIGKGVEVNDIKRAYNEFLAAQVVSAQSESSRLDSYYAHIRQIDDMLADPSAGLSPALQAFFDATSAVASSPSSVPARQSMLSASQTLVSRFHALQQRYTDIREGLDNEIRSSVSNVNSIAEQIASLNRQITVAQSGSVQQAPNDLLDQRDQLLLQLNKEVGATLVRQDDGSYNVFVGNGQALVVGGTAFALTTGYNPADPTRLSVGYAAGGGTVWLSDASLASGAMGGYLQFRTETLDVAQDALGRIALGLAGAFNAQHALGQDLNGVLGGDYFTSTFNANGVSFAVTDPAALAGGEYSLSRAGAVYTITRLSDGASVSGATPAMDGLRVTASSLADGASVVFNPMRNAAMQMRVLVSDTASIAAAAPIRTSSAATNTGTGRVSAGAVTEAVGTLTRPNPQPTVAIVFTGASAYELRAGGPGGAVLATSPPGYQAGDDISYNGWTVQVTGAPAAGDVFTVGPNGTTASDFGRTDNRNALALAQLGTSNTLFGGSASFQSAYAQLVSDIGNKTRELEVTSEAQANLLAQTVTAEQAMAGVNLDEEAANLLRYQQAYQAAARVLQIAATLFDSVLDIAR